jgi:hypothetical protein
MIKIKIKVLRCSRLGDSIGRGQSLQMQRGIAVWYIKEHPAGRQSLFQYKMSLKENSVSNTRRAWSGWHAED